MSHWTLFEPLDLSTFDFLSLGADAVGEVFSSSHFRESLGELTLDIFGDGLRFLDEEFLPVGDISGLALLASGEDLLEVLDAVWSVLRILSYYNPFTDDWDLEGLHDYLFRLADEFDGSTGDDGFEGGGGDDDIDGRSGIDSARYDGLRQDFSLARQAGSWQLADRRGQEGRDTLTNVERLHFNDGSLALDLDGHAGTVARLVGALFGKGSVGDAGLVGQGLALMDQGMSGAALAALALQTPQYLQRAGSGSHADFVRLVYTNVMGQAPSEAELNAYVQQLQGGQISQADLALLAASTAQLAAQIGLVGLQEQGLAYTPAA